MIIENLFPIPVGLFNISRPLDIVETNYIASLETHRNLGNSVSNDNYILNNSSLQNLKEFFNSCVQQYLEIIYRPSTDIKLRITQSWANYTNKGEYHHKHAHANSFISGVFYVQTDNETDKIYFYKDKYEQLSIDTREYNIYNSDSWWFKAEQGLLIVFPSSLSHMVTYTSCEDTRISISFNTFPIGKLGRINNLTELLLS